jgi:UDP-2,3-diacylglucosamine hydrolase
MNDAVFISDLHLHPKREDIQARFDAFIEWAKVSTKAVYILGDFFHVWVGDDSIDEWSRGIARQLHGLTALGISVFYMHGNRDFFLGEAFARLSGWKPIAESSIIWLDGKKILLSHGDRYCTLDKRHQQFRFLTRNRLFRAFFLSLPLSFRKRLADRMRKKSMQASKPMEVMDAIETAIVHHMKAKSVRILIHGHTHKPGISRYSNGGQEMLRYVLSDWDDRPEILSYNKPMGLYFALF